MPTAKSQLKNWHRVKLGDVAEIESGGTPSSSKPEYWDNGDICWATLPDLKNKYIFDTQRKITALGLKNSSAKLLPINSVIFSSRATIGEISITKVEASTNQGSKNFICDPRKIEYEFLYYLLKSKVDEIIGLATGATYKEINKTVFSGVEINIPDLLTQNQIADVLSVYDDLIENNTRRIKILEEIAQAIYREWFEKNAKLKNQNVKLSEIVKPQYGYTESASDEQIGPKYLRGTDINKNSYIDWSTVPYCKISDEDKKKYKLQKNDIVIIRMADPGKIGVVEQDVDAVFASYLIRLKIVDERVSPYYLFYFLNSDQYQNYIQGASGGTTRKSASAGVVTGTDIAIPPKDLVDKFEAKISLLRSELNNLLIQNANLRQARDLLLPKLVTGEISIK